jgi:hypothetical protein
VKSIGEKQARIIKPIRGSIIIGTLLSYKKYSEIVVVIHMLINSLLFYEETPKREICEKDLDS